MKNELKNKLKERFEFYKNVDSIYINDGWFQLLWDLSLNIEEKLNQLFTEDKLAKAYLISNPVFVVKQIKQKYASLVYYYDGSHEIQSLIDKAEEMSISICEYCGKPGEIRRYEFWEEVKCITCCNKEQINAK